MCKEPEHCKNVMVTNSFLTLPALRPATDRNLGQPSLSKVAEGRLVSPKRRDQREGGGIVEGSYTQRPLGFCGDEKLITTATI